MTRTEPDFLPIAASMHRYYEQRAPEYDDWYDRRGRYDDPSTNAQWHAEVDQLGRIADACAGGRVLDLACGTGRWTPHLAAPSGTRVVGADYAPAMLAQSRTRMAERGLLARLRQVRVDAYALPFPPGTFDTVFFGFWLSHVPLERVTPFLQGIVRVCRPGGHVLIFDSQQPPDRTGRVEIQDRPLKDGSRHTVLKVYYTPDQLAAALAPFGQVRQARSTGRFFVVGELEVHPGDREHTEISVSSVSPE
jgi:demethylmenaquinone methyltransferase/2-methoxy-6-polyprenyl-1,4-benzoquinol methylase